MLFRETCRTPFERAVCDQKATCWCIIPDDELIEEAGEEAPAADTVSTQLDQLREEMKAMESRLSSKIDDAARTLGALINQTA